MFVATTTYYSVTDFSYQSTSTNTVFKRAASQREKKVEQDTLEDLKRETDDEGGLRLPSKYLDASRSDPHFNFQSHRALATKLYAITLLFSPNGIVS